MTYELALMEREELGAEKAVEILKISKDEQPRYLSKLKA